MLSLTEQCIYLGRYLHVVYSKAQRIISLTPFLLNRLKCRTCSVERIEKTAHRGLIALFISFTVVKFIHSGSSNAIKFYSKERVFVRWIKVW